MYVCPPSSCLVLQIVKCRFFARTEQYLVKLFLPVIGGKYQNTTYFQSGKRISRPKFGIITGKINKYIVAKHQSKEKNVAPVKKLF